MKTSEPILAVIPARSGSKRLKHKNILPLGGRPMIAYTIQAAKDCGLFDDIIVSTDGPDVARIARKYGAAVPFLRTKSLADDHTPVSVATADALKHMQESTGKKYRSIIQLMPNCPCRTAQDIARAYAQFQESKAKFQISVFPFGWMNPWWAMTIPAKSYRPKPLFPAALKKRSQDLTRLYCPSGAVWVAGAAELLKQKTFYGQGYTAFVMNWQNALDIDDAGDFEMAKAVLQMRRVR